MKERALGHETEPPSRVMDAVHRNFSVEASATTCSDVTMKKISASGGAKHLPHFLSQSLWLTFLFLQN